VPDYDPLAPEELLDPYPGWARARREAPVFFDPGSGTWMVARHADVLAVLRDTRTFSSAHTMDAPGGARYPWTAPSLANADPPDHAVVRKLVNRAFTRTRVAALEPGVRATAAALVERVAPRGHAELIGEIAMPLAEHAALVAVGLADDERPLLRRWLRALDVTNDANAEDTAHAGADAVHVQFAERLTARLSRPAPGETLLAVLSRAGLDREVALSAVMQVLMAAVATSAHAVVHTVRALLAHGAFDLDEALRLDPAVRGMPRTVTKDVVLSGTPLRAGDELLLLFGSANRDERVFHDADGYRPGRPDGPAQLTFGRGTHFCPGAPLARVEIRAALDALMTLPGLEQDPAWPLEPYPNLAIRAFRALHLRW
jgi:cytochrome P450